MRIKDTDTGTGNSLLYNKKGSDIYIIDYLQEHSLAHKLHLSKLSSNTNSRHPLQGPNSTASQPPLLMPNLSSDKSNVMVRKKLPSKECEKTQT